jgi:hypothetical protein
MSELRNYAQSYGIDCECVDETIDASDFPKLALVAMLVDKIPRMRGNMPHGKSPRVSLGGAQLAAAARESPIAGAPGTLLLSDRTPAGQTHRPPVVLAGELETACEPSHVRATSAHGKGLFVAAHSVDGPLAPAGSSVRRAEISRAEDTKRTGLRAELKLMTPAELIAFAESTGFDCYALKHNISDTSPVGVSDLEPTRGSATVATEDETGASLDLLVEHLASIPTLGVEPTPQPFHHLAQFSGLRMSELKQRAAASPGVTAHQIEHALDGDDARGALVELIKAQSPGSTAVATEQRANMGVSSESDNEDGDGNSAREKFGECDSRAACGGSQGANMWDRLWRTVFSRQHRQDLEHLKLSQLRKQGAESGVSAEDIDIAIDADDPKTMLIELVLRTWAVSSAPTTAFVELAGLKMSVLRKRAIAAGIDAELIEDAIDEEDPRAAMMSLILAAAKIEQLAASREGARRQLQEELAGLKLTELYRRAVASTMDENTIEDAMDSVHPANALRELLLERSAPSLVATFPASPTASSPEQPAWGQELVARERTTGGPSQTDEQDKDALRTELNMMTAEELMAFGRDAIATGFDFAALEQLLNTSVVAPYGRAASTQGVSVAAVDTNKDLAVELLVVHLAADAYDPAPQLTSTASTEVEHATILTKPLSTILGGLLHVLDGPIPAGVLRRERNTLAERVEAMLLDFGAIEIAVVTSALATQAQEIAIAGITDAHQCVSDDAAMSGAQFASAAQLVTLLELGLVDAAPLSSSSRPLPLSANGGSQNVVRHEAELATAEGSTLSPQSLANPVLLLPELAMNEEMRAIIMERAEPGPDDALDCARATAKLPSTISGLPGLSRDPDDASAFEWILDAERARAAGAALNPAVALLLLPEISIGPSKLCACSTACSTALANCAAEWFAGTPVTKVVACDSAAAEPSRVDWAAKLGCALVVPLHGPVGILPDDILLALPSPNDLRLFGSGSTACTLMALAALVCERLGQRRLALDFVEACLAQSRKLMVELAGPTPNWASANWAALCVRGRLLGGCGNVREAVHAFDLATDEATRHDLPLLATLSAVFSAAAPDFGQNEIADATSKSRATELLTNYFDMQH